MEPGETLGIAAQVAVALAGFAGVVVVFGRVSAHEWSPIDRFRLRQLLASSIIPLALCMTGLLLLAIRPDFGGVWRWCSGTAFVLLLQFSIRSAKVFRRLDLQKLQRPVIRRSFFYVSGAVGIAVTLSQLYNAAFLNAFWPFFTAIVVQLIAAMLQFTRMILLPSGRQ
jgi:hypothetical protein